MRRKFLKKSIASAISVTLICSAAAALAAPVRVDTTENLFAEDFESYTAGAVTQDAMSKWYMKDDLTECAIVEDGETKALKVRNTNGAPVLALKQGTIESKLEQVAVNISFDVKVPSGADEVWGLICPVMEEAGDSTNYGQNKLIQIKREANGTDATIQITHDDSTYSEIKISADTWYKVTIEENLGKPGNWSYIATVYDASGAIIGQDYEIGSDYMGSFQSINFTNWRTGAYYVDNISIDKVSRGLEISDDMEYSSREQASKYWRINNSVSGFKKIDDAHGMTAFSTGSTEFHPCIASEPVESNYALVEFDTYLEGKDGSATNGYRFNVIDKNGTSNPGGNTIIRLAQRANDNDIDLYIADTWINQLPSGWYRVSVLLNFEDANYTVSVVDSEGVNYCEGNQNAVEVTSKAISSLAMINFTAWSADIFYFDNVSIKLLDEPPAVPKAEFDIQNRIITKNISDTNKAMGIVTTIKNVGNADGTFSKIKWTITSNGETRTINTTQFKDAIPIPQGNEIQVGCVIDGLCDENAVITAEIE